MQWRRQNLVQGRTKLTKDNLTSTQSETYYEIRAINRVRNIEEYGTGIFTG